jgi:hypothetical protein
LKRVSVLNIYRLFPLLLFSKQYNITTIYIAQTHRHYIRYYKTWIKAYSRLYTRYM